MWIITSINHRLSESISYFTLECWVSNEWKSSTSCISFQVIFAEAALATPGASIIGTSASFYKRHLLDRQIILFNNRVWTTLHKSSNEWRKYVISCLFQHNCWQYHPPQCIWWWRNCCSYCYIFLETSSWQLHLAQLVTTRALLQWSKSSRGNNECHLVQLHELIVLR